VVVPLFWLQQQDEQHIAQSNDAHHPDVSIQDLMYIALGFCQWNGCP
jgi:hypothetical protein